MQKVKDFYPACRWLDRIVTQTKACTPLGSAHPPTDEAVQEEYTHTHTHPELHFSPGTKSDWMDLQGPQRLRERLRKVWEKEFKVYASAGGSWAKEVEVPRTQPNDIATA